MKNPTKGMSLDLFMSQIEEDYAQLPGKFALLMQNIVEASLKIHHEVNRAGLGDVMGKLGTENIQGEEVMKLDEYANNVLIDSLKSGSQCIAVASEELDTILVFDESTVGSKPYLVLFDPLDGSSNIDTNAPIGTIFSICERKSNSATIEEKDFFQKGREIVAAGYVLYGSSTMLVFSTGKGVNGFTLDVSKNQFCLSHPNIQTPETAQQFSVNYGQQASFSQGLNKFVSWCTEENPVHKAPFSIRYIGSMVADFHRNLIKGGIFIYPSTAKAPNGKLRLLYECIPLSFLQEQAGGLSTDDKQSVLDIIPTELHQRTPVALGSQSLVSKYIEFVSI